MSTCTLSKVLVVSFLFTFNSCDIEGDEPENIRFTLLNAVNELRLAGCTCGSDAMPPVSPLKWNAALEDAAAAHARDMIQREYFDHISLDGLSPVDRAHLAGYEGENVGENIGRYYQTTKGVMNAWKASESHCRALMDGDYTEMGAAKVKTYWVLDFGNP